MKQFILSLTMALCAVCAAAQESFIGKLGKADGVTSVYVSKTLLGMMPDMKSDGMNFGAVASKLDNIQILTSETKSGAKTLKNGCRQIIADGRYEYLMNVNDNGEQSGIYMKNFPGGTSQYVLLTVEKNETSVIVLTGKLTLQDIKNVMGGK